MNNLLKHPVLYFLLFPGLVPVKGLAQEKEVILRIQQEESFLLDSYDKTISLKKNTFKIQVYLHHVEGIYVYAGYDDSLYRLTETDPIPGFAGLPSLVMAEEHFNKEKEVLLSREGWSYWFYKPELDWHRFNKKIVIIDSNRVVGSKTIKQVYHVDGKKEKKLKEIKQPLYLFFVAVSENDEKGNPRRELMRRKVKIEWTNED